MDIVEELPSNPTNPKVETIDEAELELVCEGPPPKKKAPMVVDLTLSSDSEEDSDTLMSIKERMLSRQRSSGSQSSCPADSADESTTVTNGNSRLYFFIRHFCLTHFFISTCQPKQQCEYGNWQQ